MQLHCNYCTNAILISINQNGKRKKYIYMHRNWKKKFKKINKIIIRHRHTQPNSSI